MKTRMTLRLEPIIDGPETGETLVFLQGWPDDATLWDSHVASLSGRYRCIRTTLPNFDGRRSVRWGYTTDEIVAALAEMIRTAAPGRTVTLILHDWGCFWGHRLHQQNPQLVARVASLDVAPHVEPSPAAMLGIIAYQWWLLFAFLIDGAVGDAMTRALAGAMGAPLPRAQITSWMNYPYRNIWRELLTGTTRRQTDYWPTVPLLYVYGTKKPFPFHSQKWLDHVESTGGTVAALDCGHWVSRDPAFAPILANWLASSSHQP